MKLISRLILYLIILSLLVGCNNIELFKTRNELGSIKDITAFLSDERGTRTYKGTGNYYHEMVLEDIVTSNQSIYYKFKVEVLSDKNNSNFGDYSTEIRYIASRKGLQQELRESKFLDSKYKGMYLLKFPIEKNNEWQEKVLDFDNNEKTITGKIESIDVINDEKIIKVRYSEKNSDYYEIRKIIEGKGIVEFQKNMKINEEDHILKYSLEDIYYDDGPMKSEIKIFLESYNKAWENYYNDKKQGIFSFIDKNSALSSNISSFRKIDNTRITFLELIVKSVLVDGNQYEIEVNESFSVKKNREQYIQSEKRSYTLIRKDENFKIIKIE